ncbi:hypothetical protein KCV87_32150 [Actinosynnema pretiosum subsp. pretiosum]|uniref:Uncharacterized protein n=1 Tax=Actinosynnema pretiosum subsp. pretiosum TaxID=103721 RepID=A0AA45L615_9PSEU|nr:hypothetical protein APASM_4709 [Actinosynnema pretiosum subsp. pretiosum]QUF03956.1 hypothetical protein KCV87_32150 [Actinosynnema pretiosum subsp. pretiosum]
MPTGADLDHVWTLQHQNSGRAGRLHDAAMLYPGVGGPMAYRDGVLVSATDPADGIVNDLRILPAAGTPSRSLRVLPGQCVVTPSGTGPYLATLEATRSITLDEAHATLPRIDSVFVRVQDDAVGGGGVTRGTLHPVTGLPASTPVAPGTPPDCSRIGDVTVPSLATMPITQLSSAQITLRRKGTTLRGGARYLLEDDNAAEAGPHIGAERIYARMLQIWTGAGWDTIRRLGDSRPSLTAVLRRDDGQEIVNGTGKDTNLGVFQASTTGTGWNTSYLSRGASHPRDGLWWLEMSLLSDVASARYIDASFTQVTNSGTTAHNFPAKDTATTGFGGTGGSRLVRVPPGESLRVLFDVYKNNAPDARILAGSYVRLVWLGEP